MALPKIGCWDSDLGSRFLLSFPSCQCPCLTWPTLDRDIDLGVSVLEPPLLQTLQTLHPSLTMALFCIRSPPLMQRPNLAICLPAKAEHT